MTGPVAAATLLIMVLTVGGLAWAGPVGAAGFILAAAGVAYLYGRLDAVLGPFLLGTARWLEEDFSLHYEGRGRSQLDEIGVRLHKCNKGMGKYIAGIKGHTAELVSAAGEVRAAAEDVSGLARRQAGEAAVLQQSVMQLGRDAGRGREGAAAAVQLADCSVRTAGDGQPVLHALTRELAGLEAALGRLQGMASSIAGTV